MSSVRTAAVIAVTTIVPAGLALSMKTGLAYAVTTPAVATSGSGQILRAWSSTPSGSTQHLGEGDAILLVDASPAPEESSIADGASASFD